MIDLEKLQRIAERAVHINADKEQLFNANEVIAVFERLRQAEKDAARYRWIKENSQFGVGRCGVDWELYFEGPAPDNSAMIERHIDEAMQCK